MDQPRKTRRRASTGGGAPQASFDDSLGAQIRELRHARSMTLVDLADRVGCSPGYLSQVERNISVPTINSLHNIAAALSVNISWFFNEDKQSDSRERPYIVRAGNRRTLSFGSGVVDELLSPHLRGRLELLSCRFEPGAASGDEPYQHRGEEAGLVVTGQLEIWVGDDRFMLYEGDSFGFPSTMPHRYRNPGQSETRVIWAITPPSY